MLYRSRPPIDDVYLLLPDDALLSAFEGFNPINADDIPAGVRVLVWPGDELLKVFGSLRGKLISGKNAPP